MDGQTRQIKESFIGQSKTIPTIQRNRQVKNEIKNFGFFAVKPESENVRRFKLRFRDGQTITVPYAFLPVIRLDQNGQIHITSGDMLIRIMGRVLNELEEWLSAEKVIWIKESESGSDENQEGIFISSIETEGL